MGRNRHNPSTRARGKTYRLRPRVLARDNYTCQMCYSPNWHEIDLTIDHIVPASLGGPTTMDNLRTLCRVCCFTLQKRQGAWHAKYGNGRKTFKRSLHSSGQENPPCPM